jgi:Phosphatidylinositol-4-phosphate 5-Kinase
LVGIIDPLNCYDYTKKFEYNFKRLTTGGANMSCVPPEIYAPRFHSFMVASLVEGAAQIKKETIDLTH